MLQRTSPRPNAGTRPATHKHLRVFSYIALCVLSFTFLFASSSTANKAKAASYNDYADTTASTLMQWYNNGSGQWDTTGWWNSANALTAIIDYKSRTGSSSYNDIISNTYNHNNSNGFINDWNDDSMWWGLAWERAYDITGNQAYLNTAKGIANHVHTAWDGTCNGGLWNNDAHDHKDAITNELFLKLTAGLHNRISGDTQYLQWANDEWSWFSGTAMIDSSSHLVHNGIARDCSLESYVFTYNQGVILGGLLELSSATGDSSYINTAQSIADAATTDSTLVNANGILVEVVGASVDDVTFKGVMMRNLYELWAHTHTQSYADFIHRQADSLWNSDRNGSNQFGYLWQGPFDTASAGRQQSALDTMNAAVGVGGSPSGGGGSAGQELFSDDFEGNNANQWNVYDGSWSVCSVGSNSLEYCGASGSENISFAGNTSWTNYSVRSYLVASSTSGGISLLGRVQDGNHFYQLEVKDGNRWGIWKNNGGSWSNIASGSFNWSANSYYLFKFDLNGNTLAASYSSDNGNSWNSLGSGNDGTWSSGKIGVRLSNITGRFDQVKVIAD